MPRRRRPDIRRLCGPVLLASLYLFACALGPLEASAQPAPARSVSVNGVMGQKALLVIDGQTQMVSEGASRSGVKVLAVRPDEVLVEIDGRRLTLAVGGAPASVGARSGPASGTRIVLSASSGGHFATDGSINGRQVQFLVDTGASLVSIGQAVADRIGLDYHQGAPAMAKTANGIVPVRRLTLSSVRVGGVEVYNVEAVVLPNSMDTVLLGNSFLSRFQMTRAGDQMVLDKRY